MDTAQNSELSANDSGTNQPIKPVFLKANKRYLSDDQLLDSFNKITPLSSTNLVLYKREFQLLILACSTKEQVRMLQRHHNELGRQLSDLSRTWSTIRKDCNESIVHRLRSFPSSIKQISERSQRSLQDIKDKEDQLKATDLLSLKIMKIENDQSVIRDSLVQLRDLLTQNYSDSHKENGEPAIAEGDTVNENER